MDKKLILWTKNWAEQFKTPILILESTASSNTFAKTLTPKPKGLLLILAKQQTAPRGRGKNQWIKSCFMGTWTWIQKSAVHPVLSPLIGQHLYLSCLSAWPKLPWTLKPPNDLLLNKKKTAGLLVEVLTQGGESQVIAGLGMNVFQAPDISILEKKTKSSSAGCMSFYDNIFEDSWNNFLNSFSKRLHSLQNKKTASLSS